MIIEVLPESYDLTEDVGTVEYCLRVMAPAVGVTLPFEITVNLTTTSDSAGTRSDHKRG